MEARRWLETATPASDYPLINVSQAAPVDPPPLAMRNAIAEIALNDPNAHLYGPVLGLPELREALAQTWSDEYRGHVAPDQIAITSGCNQAFCTAVSALAQSGDEIILPTPWYFNHKMWLDMADVRAVPLPTGQDMLPDPERAKTLITPNTRAIVLVTPNNPSGAEYTPRLIRAFFDLAQSHGIALIVDETYRDFRSSESPAHDLFGDPSWQDTLVHLYSFSKAFRLTGHRVGALIADHKLLSQIEKVLDTVTICPNQIGQRAALWGLRNLNDWLAKERLEILARRASIETIFPKLAGWRLLSCGAYFAYVEHPYDIPALALAQRLVGERGVLLLPGSMFYPDDAAESAKQLRIAFANIDQQGIEKLFDRLAGYAP